MLSIRPPSTQSGAACHVGRYAAWTVCFLSGHLLRGVGRYATWGGMHRRRYAFYPATSYAEWGGMPRGAVCIVNGMLSIRPPPTQREAACHLGRYASSTVCFLSCHLLRRVGWHATWG